jgi:hypothetical protein
MEARETRRGAIETARAYATFAGMLFHAQPFIRDVFLTPMDLVDPSGVRLREAFKRFQQLGAKPGVAARPFGRFMIGLQEMYLHPVIGPIFGGVLGRVSGVGGRFLERLNDPEELEEAAKKSYEELAQEALAAKRTPESSSRGHA